jgi:hypothetical protein
VRTGVRIPVGTPILNAGRVRAEGVTAHIHPCYHRGTLPPPLTRPIFMGDNEAGLSAIGILIHEHHENHFGNVRDFVSEG